MGCRKPAVDSISGLSPTLSIDQHLINRSPRSTVGTASDVYTYLRILFARLGSQPCSKCGLIIPPSFDSFSLEDAGETNLDDTEDVQMILCPHCAAPMQRLTMGHFSFNKPEGACPTCAGLGTIQQAHLSRLVDGQKSIGEGAVSGWDTHYLERYTSILQAAAVYYGFEFDLSLLVKDYNDVQHDLLFYGVESPLFRRHFPQIEPPATVRQGRFEGVATNLLRRYNDHITGHAHEEDYHDKLEELLVKQTCPDCGGSRLRAGRLGVTIKGQNIIQVSKLPLSDLEAWLSTLPAIFNADEMTLAGPVLTDLNIRIERLIEVGAGYLTPERSSASLSAGEAQRLRLASLLGSDLSGLLYVFDEPTVGLHQRDTRRLIGVLQRLRDLGNSVLVIEHDLEMIAAADYLVDFGPEAGKQGGKIVACGTPVEVAGQPDSLTGNYLSGRILFPHPTHPRIPRGPALMISGACEHNLKNLDIRIPLGLLVAVTGVSGSGKSTLIFDILDRALRQRWYDASVPVGAFGSIEGIEFLDKVITIDQEPIGRIPRSNAATYTDLFTPIREVFAATPVARQNGLSARHFSFNLPGGRCEHCQGAGVLTVKMQLLPDVEVRCPTCHGRRFKNEILMVRYHDYDISQVLELTMEEALSFFEDVPFVRARLQILCDVGLGYLQLGQPATTLSGGEAQRVKLAKELGRRASGRTLYLFDEPTTGLHLADITRLLAVLQRLVKYGNSVIVVEHQLDVIANADWVIDLGPEGGAGGGYLVAEGTPQQIMLNPLSITGQCLAQIFHNQDKA